jgi:hypothetical protein
MLISAIGEYWRTRDPAEVQPVVQRLTTFNACSCRKLCGGSALPILSTGRRDVSGNSEYRPMQSGLLPDEAAHRKRIVH